MAFTPNIPTDDESLNDSRPEISGNFQALREAFSVDFTGDHVDPNDADAGKHWWVRMLDVGADTPPGLDNQLSFFVKNDTLGASQIFYKEAGAAGAQVQVTTKVTSNASGRSVPIIGGLCMKVGKIVGATTATKNWVAETGSNFTGNPIYYSVNAPSANPLTIARTVSVSATQFSYNVANGPVDVYYIAIGFPA